MLISQKSKKNNNSNNNNREREGNRGAEGQGQACPAGTAGGLPQAGAGTTQRSGEPYLQQRESQAHSFWDGQGFVEANTANRRWKRSRELRDWATLRACRPWSEISDFLLPKTEFYKSIGN